MNERIRQLIEQAGTTEVVNVVDTGDGRMETQVVKEFDREWFALLIVRECIKECKQEWYDLNAESVADDDPFLDPRATGIRVGQKAGVLKCISKIKQHFGVEE